MKRKISTLVPWFGSNRTLAHNVGSLLGGKKWLGVPFAGGMSELRYLNSPTIVVSDLHRHVINLADVVANADWCNYLQGDLERFAFHPDTLRHAQQVCREEAAQLHEEPSLRWATAYFVCAWMSRNGTAGTKAEFDAGLSVRWDSGGGDSNTRYRNALASLTEWQGILAKCNFVCLDVFEFLDKCKDAHENGLYLDPPFPTTGDDYLHTFTEEQHATLADRLASYNKTAVVCRFYDHELVRKLYSINRGWNWLRLSGGRRSNNVSGPEVLITRNLKAEL